jgi:Eco57I restriction endonuclease.
LLKRCIAENKNFFNDYLEYLFYEALATTEGRATIDLSYYPKFDCKIPFLNGGLFEATYDWKNTNILLPDELFSNNERTKAGDTGTGILDIFDRYNFTVKEDEPLEKEVAVDPEMLGKVFENLLPENLRKGQGTYYTPREIVHYMCQESLINYLDTAVNTEEISLLQEKPTQQKLFGGPEPEQLNLKGTGHKTIIPKKHIGNFIHKGEFAIEHDTAKEEGTNSYKYQIDESIRKNAQLLDEKLKNIKICDPAIGSGAFPVGMMHEIVKARNVLETYLKTGKKAYEFKRHCIQESLYGVDIDPGAIEIAKLRLWLSLVVDEENYLDIKPLPNLDYKIMQGNTLLEDFHGVSLNLEKNDELLFSENEELALLIEDLHRKQSEFFNAIHHSDKIRLREEVEDAIIKVFHHELKRQQEQYFKALDRINKMASGFPKEEDRKKCYDAGKAKLDKRYKFDFEAVENELREMTHGSKIRNFFPWKLYFADLFRKNSGFDVVIANPPYIRIQKIEKPLKQAFSKNYQSATKNYDIYTLFDERGINLLRPGGFFAYIQPNKFFNSDYGVGLRNFLTSNNYLYKLVNFGNAQVFDTATIYTTLLFCKKANNKSFDYVAFSEQNTSEEFLNYVSQVLSTNIIQKQFSKKHITSDNWVFGDDDTLSIFKKLESTGNPLSTFTQKTFQGIVTSADPVYCLEEIDSRLWSPHLGKFVDIPFADAKPLLKGKEIRRYCTEPNKYWLIFPYSLDGHRPKLFSDKGYKLKHPEIWNYLKRCEKKLRSRENGKMNHDQWYAFGRNQNLDQFEQPKLMLQVLAKKASITLDESNNYYFVGGGNAGGYGITLKDGSDLSYKYLLGLLNSTLLDFYLQKHSSMFQNGYYSYAKRFIEKVPIVEVSQIEQGSIIFLVDKILTLKKTDSQADTSTLEAEIDWLVYKIYDLTAEEIAIVEESAGR